ncbi:MAG: PGF-CTERM sorting domain-containing protein [Halobacteriales archaeon]
MILGVSAVSAQAPADGMDEGSGVGSSDGGFGAEMNESSSADSVYVRDDGSGVLVYNGTEDTNGSVSFGADMSTGLLHLVANGTGGEGFEGDLSMEAEPNSWLANGSFMATDTGMLEDLTLDVTSQSDDSDSSMDADVDATVSSGLASFAPTATTEGEVVRESDSLTSSGSVEYETALGGGGSSEREVRNFDLTEDDGDYVLDARERRIVRGGVSQTGEEDPSSMSEEDYATENGTYEPPEDTVETQLTHPAEEWGTRERAEETLNEQYTAFADNLSATANLTLESYSFENVTVDSGGGATVNQSLIDVEYTVEYTGVQDGLADTLAEEMSGNVSEETANELAQGVRNLSINRLSFASVSDENGSEFNWSVDVENYNDVFTSFLRLSSEMEPSGMETGTGAGMDSDETSSSAFFSEGYFDEILNMSEQQTEASEAAGLVSTWEWSGSLEPEGGASSSPFGSGGGSDATATFTADVSHDTENWGDYVDELEDRDIPMADSSFDLSASTTDAGVEGDMKWEASGEALAEGYQTTLNTYESAFQGSDEVDPSVFQHINNSGFRVAKMDATVGDGTWDVEAGAAFENGSALSAAIETETGYGVTQVVGTTENNRTTTYIKSDSLVDEPTEDAVRSLDEVDDETTVNLPDDWDRDFPEMDTNTAAEYLGVEAGGADEDGSPLPGFGALVALVALVAVAVAHRHHG